MTGNMPRRSVKLAQPVSHPPFPTHLFVQDICNSFYVALYVRSDHDVCHVSVFVVVFAVPTAHCFAARGVHFVAFHYICMLLACLLCGYAGAHSPGLTGDAPSLFGQGRFGRQKGAWRKARFSRQLSDSGAIVLAHHSEQSRFFCSLSPFFRQLQRWPGFFISRVHSGGLSSCS